MYGMTFTVLLITVVVSGLVSVVIWGMVAVLDRSSRGRAAEATPSAATATPRPAAASPALESSRPAAALTAGGHPPAHIAAITAAVASVFDDSAVVVHIEPSRGGTGWASEGRAVHHGSHNVGRSPR